jgi:hypothetical protein
MGMLLVLQHFDVFLQLLTLCQLSMVVVLHVKWCIINGVKSAKCFLKHSNLSIHHPKTIQEEQFGSYSILEHP